MQSYSVGIYVAQSTLPNLAEVETICARVVEVLLQLQPTT